MLSIHVVRNKGWYGLARTAQIMADDTEIGRVKCGATASVQIPDNTENLYAKMDWGWSEPFPVDDLKDGQTIYMNAWFTFNIGLSPIPVALEFEPR